MSKSLSAIWVESYLNTSERLSVKSLTEDCIFIEDLNVSAIIGIYPWERVQEQLLKLSLNFQADIKSAATSKSLDDTVDYSDVAKRLEEFIQANQFLLLETLAEDTASWLHENYHIKWLELKVEKPQAIKNAASVGVKIFREW